MKSEHKKEYFVIILIVVIAAAILYWRSHQPMPITIKNTGTPIILGDEDFTLKTASGSVYVGKSTYEETLAVYPQGKNLGLSTLYRPEGHRILFEFSKKSNILTVVHIEEPGLGTIRGVEVGSSVDQVTAAYGDEYSSVSTDKPGGLDMVYGEGNKIVFRTENSIVTKIVIQHDPAARK